jgi:DNA-binding CsgD family transcriptional regulator
MLYDTKDLALESLVVHPHELAAVLESAPAGARLLPAVVAQLRRMLHADQACAFLVRVEGDRRELEFFHGERMPAGIGPAFRKWLQRAPKRFAGYDPARPELTQRNVALCSEEILALTSRRTPAVVRSFLPRFALSESDVVRVLVCEGPALLAWVGAFRAAKFSRAEVRRLDELVPALQRRLALEQKLADAERLAADLGAALEHVPAPAFVVREGTAVVYANAAGRAMHRARVLERLRSPDKSARLSGELQLVILDVPRSDPAPLVALAALRWSLTPRQAEVLELVARGFSNRAVAESLGCAGSTVELHVGALLDKAECESRAQLMARLWSGA